MLCRICFCFKCGVRVLGDVYRAQGCKRSGAEVPRAGAHPHPTPLAPSHPPHRTPHPHPAPPTPHPISTTFSITFARNVMLNVVLIGCGVGGAVVGPTPPLTPPPPLDRLTRTLTLHPAHPAQSPERCTLRVYVQQKPYVSFLLKLGFGVEG